MSMQKCKPFLLRMIARMRLLCCKLQLQRVKGKGGTTQELKYFVVTMGSGTTYTYHTHAAQTSSMQFELMQDKYLLITNLYKNIGHNHLMHSNVFIYIENCKIDPSVILPGFF